MADESPQSRASVLDLAVERKLLSAAQAEEVRELLRKSKRIGLESTPEELLVKQKLLSEAQVQELTHIAELTEGGTVFGNYRLGTLLGEGGMGKVYEAVHEVMNRTVALKVVSNEFTKDKTSAARFFLEIRALAKLNHPSIVAIYDCGRVGRRYYYAMEFVGGGSLKSVVDKRSMLPEREALAIIRGMALALSHAHASNVVHRDVKPENVLICEDGSAKLTDFGLVMHQDADHMSLTQSGMMVGSYYYVSPEQLDGVKDIDGRADIYSLGATLYYALTGKTAFSGKTPQEIVAQTLSGTWVTPRNYNPTVSTRSVRLLRRMMARSRDKRFQNMSDVVAAIDALLAPPKLKRYFLVSGATLLLLGLGMLIERLFGLLARL